MTDQAEELFPIRTVSGLTGVNAVTLRAWERRYGLLKPRRTAKGHRLYTREDIAVIHRTVALLDRGLAISQVPGALGAEPAAETDEGTVWERYRHLMVAAITGFDEVALEETYNEALSLYPIDVVTRQLLVPLLRELGERWERSEGSVAEEHFFSVYMRSKLGARLHHLNRRQRGPRLLCACLPGEHHETGLLLFALAAHDHDYLSVVLGANMPLEEIPLALHRSAAAALVLSGSIDPEPELWRQGLPELVAGSPVPVFVGGQTSVRHRQAVVKAGAIALGDDIGVGMRRLDAVLSGRSRHD